MGAPSNGINAWLAAADVLDGATVNPELEEAGHVVLAKLGFANPIAASQADHHTRVTFLRFAGRMSDIFEIVPPDAPGLRFVGGMTLPSLHLSRPLIDRSLSSGGRGRTFGDGFMSCVGEAVERVSQYQTEADMLVRSPLETGLSQLSATAADGIRRMLEGRAVPDGEVEWLTARVLSTGAECLIPADLCVVRPDDGQVPLSTNSSLGCSSGATREQALLSGLLEVVERDAAALWWLAGQPARVVPVEALEQGGVPELARDVRLAATSRRTWFLDITTDLEIPCVVSLSFQAEGGGFAHGVAARSTLGEAAAAAFLEMCQMEVAYHLLALKLAGGDETKLSPADRRHRQRFVSIDPDRHAILLPKRSPSVDLQSKIETSDSLVEKLSERGLQCLAVDLTRAEIGVPVCKVFVPGLQPMPSGVRTERLREAALTGNGAFAMDIPLF